MTNLQNKVQLITYPDSLGKDLKDLNLVLDVYLKDVISGVHVLSFYPSSAGRGSAPLTHMEVDADFGTWKDIRKIGKDRDLIVDLIMDHMSSDSRYFQDFLKKGDNSQWKELFLDVDELLERYGEDSEESLKEISRPDTELPMKEFSFEDGTTKRLWCMFSDGGIGLDLTKDKTRELMEEFILNLIKNNTKVIRLGAVGYVIKKPKTNSFLLPETYDIIKWIKKISEHYNVELLAEIHHEYKKQPELANSPCVDRVYDFSLPLLVLHALYSGTNNNLKNWIQIRSDDQFTTLDTQDGISVVDVKGFMSEEEVNDTITKIRRNGGNKTMRFSGDGSDDVGIYQINSTYYSALKENDDAYIAARAIQFFIPGIPQVYYVGLFAGKNDTELFEKTNCGEDINRHNYTLDELKEETERTVVKRLFRLMKFRNTYPAFNGEFSLEKSDAHELRLKWELDDIYCIAKIDLQKYTVIVEYVDLKEKRSVVKAF
ncbi:MAG: sucrose phosphorylase [Candidatus Pacebacteria bacterium]|nr:sucrose phosphorylase [Candidatus Paceibacterota bacterium]